MTKAVDKIQEIEQQRRDNMTLWNRVKTPDPAFTKKLTHGAKLTTVDAHYSLQLATSMWGPIGDKWGVIDESDELVSDGTGRPLFVVYRLTIFYPVVNGSSTTKGYSRAVADWDIPYTKEGKYRGDDAYKKARTAALSKAFSQIGFHADVYLGKYDGQGKADVFSSQDEFKQFSQVEQQIAKAGTAKDLDTLMSRLKVRHDTDQISEAAYSAAVEAVNSKRGELEAAK